MNPSARALLCCTAALGIAAPAAAQTVDFGTWCNTASGSTACATASARLFSNYMEVYVQNAQGPGGFGDASRITAFGLYYIGGPTMGPQGTLGGTIPGGGWGNVASGGGKVGSPAGNESWLLATDVQGNGGVYGCADPTGNGSDVSSCAGPLTFRFNGINAAAVRLDDLHFAFKAQSVGRNGASVKCYSTDPASSQHDCTPQVTVAVLPEPATVALLATGLLGIGGITVRRRQAVSA